MNPKENLRDAGRCKKGRADDNSELLSRILAQQAGRLVKSTFDHIS
jgi:hypothetical protein